MNVDDKGIKEILQNHKSICVIGITGDESKPSNRIPMFMKSKGYKISGVHPRGEDIGGCKVYSNLDQVPSDELEFINVFRRSEAIPEVVDQVIKLGKTKVLWLQLGIEHPEAEKRAEASGIKVVSNRCLYVEYLKWM